MPVVLLWNESPPGAIVTPMTFLKKQTLFLAAIAIFFGPCVTVALSTADQLQLFQGMPLAQQKSLLQMAPPEFPNMGLVGGSLRPKKKILVERLPLKSDEKNDTLTSVTLEPTVTKIPHLSRIEKLFARSKLAQLKARDRKRRDDRESLGTSNAKTKAEAIAPMEDFSRLQILSHPSTFNAISKPYDPQWNDVVEPDLDWDLDQDIIESLPWQFGYDVFSTESQGDSEEKEHVADSYVLGPGDRLSVRIWGKMEQSFELEIDANGKGYLPKIGNISLAGATFGAAKGLIQREYAKQFVNFEMSVTVSGLRSIKVFILGDVNRPGAYSMSAMSTLFTALYQAGGPSKMGSLRNVTLKRRNGTDRKVDLYRYLLYGDRFQASILQDMDTIFVPPIGDVVLIEGLVKRPAIFEIAAGTSAWEALQQYAGGLAPYAEGKQIQVERVVSGERITLFDYSFQSEKDLTVSFRERILKDGDVLRILPLVETRKNVVQVGGAVMRPGEYAVSAGMNVKILIDKCEGLTPGAVPNRVEIYRATSATQKQLIVADLTTHTGRATELKEGDVVRVYDQSEVVGKRYVSIEGEVFKQGQFELPLGTKLADLLSWARPKSVADLTKVEVARMPTSNTGFQRILVVDATRLVTDAASSANILLRENDHVFIRVSPAVSRVINIQLTGEFDYPGFYQAKSGDRLSDLILRAGGFTDRAFLKGAVLIRKSAKDKETRSLKRIWEEENRLLRYSQVDPFNGKKNSAQMEDASLEMRSSEGMGRVVIDLKPLATLPGTKDDILLEDGDSMEVPATPFSIQVVGAVQNPVSVLFVVGKGPQFYIDQSGGFLDYANRDRIYVLRADGTVQANANVVEYGDTIYVATRPIYDVDWLKILTQTTQVIVNVATSLIVLRSL